MKFRAERLLGSAAGVVGVSVALMAAFGIAHGIESPSAAPQAEARILVAQAESTKVSFTTEQVDRGKKVFNEDCVECHGKDMRGGLLGGPPLRGQAFLSKYQDGPAGTLFEIMQTTMPPNAPGSYAPSVYADIMAHILKTNTFKAGGAELPSDVDALYNLTIEK